MELCAWGNRRGGNRTLSRRSSTVYRAYKAPGHACGRAVVDEVQLGKRWDAAGLYRRGIRRLNMARPHHTRPSSRGKPKVSISVIYEAVGHDKAAYERLLECLRELARSKESFQDQESKS